MAKPLTIEELNSIINHKYNKNEITKKNTIKKKLRQNTTQQAQSKKNKSK